MTLFVAIWEFKSLYPISLINEHMAKDIHKKKEKARCQWSPLFDWLMQIKF